MQVPISNRTKTIATTMVMPPKRIKRQRKDQSKYVCFALLALIIFWSISAGCLWIRYQKEEKIQRGQHEQKTPKSKLLSRFDNVISTADVRGNLGPASVVIQKSPGNDWIKDRWQAASNMHGMNIPGHHWVLLQFESEIVVNNIVLDWEAAYADEYRLEGSIKDPTSNEKIESWVLFDGTDPSQEKFRSIKKSGQSPGVKTKTPLHVVHTLTPITSKKPLRYLRLYILKSAMGWGVSLWQFDVYGFQSS